MKNIKITKESLTDNLEGLRGGILTCRSPYLSLPVLWNSGSELCDSLGTSPVFGT